MQSCSRRNSVQTCVRYATQLIKLRAQLRSPSSFSLFSSANDSESLYPISDHDIQYWCEDDTTNVISYYRGEEDEDEEENMDDQSSQLTNLSELVRQHKKNEERYYAQKQCHLSLPPKLSYQTKHHLGFRARSRTMLALNEPATTVDSCIRGRPCFKSFATVSNLLLLTACDQDNDDDDDGHPSPSSTHHLHQAQKTPEPQISLSVAAEAAAYIARERRPVLRSRRRMQE